MKATRDPMADVAAAPTGKELSPQHKAFSGYMLTVSYGVQYVAEFFCRQTKEQLWINLCTYSRTGQWESNPHHNFIFWDGLSTRLRVVADPGNTVGLGIIRGQLYSISQILGFFITPLLGGLSDSFGRKPVLILGAMLYQIATATVLLTKASLPGVSLHPHHTLISRDVPMSLRVLCGAS